VTTLAHDIATGTILVTGASGSLGSQLLYELTQRGLKPIAHVRPSSDTTFIDSLGLEKRTADLRIRPELAQLVNGVDFVIHTAAWVDFRGNRLTQFAGINTIGALEMYRAAAQAGVKRFLHVSTVAAVGALPRKVAADGSLPPVRRLTENWQFNLEHLRVP
jgi:nucleoside-diphosphate-sugar epimerase